MKQKKKKYRKGDKKNVRTVRMTNVTTEKNSAITKVETSQVLIKPISPNLPQELIAEKAITGTRTVQPDKNLIFSYIEKVPTKGRLNYYRLCELWFFFLTNLHKINASTRL